MVSLHVSRTSSGSGRVELAEVEYHDIGSWRQRGAGGCRRGGAGGRWPAPPTPPAASSSPSRSIMGAPRHEHSSGQHRTMRGCPRVWQSTGGQTRLGHDSTVFFVFRMNMATSWRL
ncbi:hypothetical protein ACQJBY_015439 [Aegilops geniculata]